MLTLSRTNSVGDAIRDSIVTHKTNVALIEADRHRENGRWTYRDLKTQAERFGALLQGEGVSAGDRCAILMQNQSKWIFSGLGAFWAGAIVVPIDYKLSPTEQMGLLAHCRPKVLVTEYSTWLKLQKEASGPLEQTLVLVTEAPADATLGPARRWESTPRCEFVYVERDREDIATIVYSSGTSGRPKGCLLTHGNYLSQVELLGRVFPLEEGDRYFSILPTNHAIDFMVGFVGSLLYGASVIHQRSLRPQYIRHSLKHYEITHISVVPTILRNLQKRIQERLDDLPHWQRTAIDGLKRINEIATARKPRHEVSRLLLKPIHDELGGHLRVIFAGGTFVDADLAQFFYDLGVPVAVGYGLTEASTVITVNDLRPFRANTVGKPIPGVEVELREVNEQGIGEVYVRGPTVMKGYYRDPELTAETIVDGWLRTGDLGSMDISGHLKLVGRAKNMIVTEGGKNIYPEDIERVFEDLPGCEEHCVFAANYVWPAGTMTGDELVLVVRPKDDADLAALVEALRRRNLTLTEYKRISGYVVHHDEFPVTASMKVKRRELAVELQRRPRLESVVALEA